MGKLEEILTRYEVDYRVTLARFLNDEKFYMKCFEMFLRDDNLDKLGGALEQGKLDDAFVYAHTLKGVVGNMGFTPMYRAVCAIVEPLRSRSADADYCRLYADLTAEADRVKKMKTEADAAL